MSAEHQVPSVTTPVEVAVSNEMVRLYKSQFGRGPTRARTEWAATPS